MKARLTLKVRAGARKTAISGRLGTAWKIQVAAPPVDGKANDEIMRFIARLAGVPAGSVRIVSGFGAPLKIIEVNGIDNERLERAILESHGPDPDTGSAAPRKS